MELMTIENNFNRGKMDIKEIKWLIDTVKLLEQENGAMAEKLAEKDIAMADFMQIIEQQKARIKELEFHARDLNESVFTHAMNEERLLEQNKKFRKRIFELREKTGYRVYEENLALLQQIELYKEMLKGGTENEQCQTSNSLS